MSDNATPASQWYTTLQPIEAHLAALTSEVTMIARQVAWLAQGNQAYWPAAYAPSSPPPRPDAATQYYALRTAVVVAVQWHGWGRGPHDLGVVSHPAGSASHGWLSDGQTRAGGIAVHPGDWIVLTLEGVRAVVNADVFASTYVRALPTLPYEVPDGR